MTDTMPETGRLTFDLWPWAFLACNSMSFVHGPFRAFFGGGTLQYTFAWRCVAGVHTALFNVAEITCHEVKDIRNKDEVAKCLKTVLSSKMVR
jgi:hypothetical protein